MTKTYASRAGARRAAAAAGLDLDSLMFFQDEGRWAWVRNLGRADPVDTSRAADRSPEVAKAKARSVKPALLDSPEAKAAICANAKALRGLKGRRAVVRGPGTRYLVATASHLAIAAAMGVLPKRYAIVPTSVRPIRFG